MTIVLRPRQVQAIADLRQAIADGSRAPICIAPTGSGKTVVAGGIIQGVIQKQKKALFLAHRQELIDQARDKLRDFGIKSGVIQSTKYMDLAPPVQVASVQTLVRRMHKLDWRPDIILIDECHLSNAKTYKTIVEFYDTPLLIGLTATPQRLDGKGLGVGHGGMFDALVIAGSTAELIHEGHLCPYKYFAPPAVDTSQVATVAGEFSVPGLEAVTDKPKITGDFIEHWNTHARGMPTMVFTCSVRHAEHVAEQVRAVGLKAVAVSGDSRTDLRRNAVRDVQSGALDMLINCGLFVEGLDAPALSCLGDLAATKSVSRFRQKIGRVLRIFPGKGKAIILDHVGNCKMHGLPDMDIEWSLEGRKKRSGARAMAMMECHECWCVHPLAPKCPECGNVYATKDRGPPDAVDGILVEINADMLKKQQHREVSGARTREALEAIARQRGYKPGWVDYILRARGANREPQPLGIADHRHQSHV